MTAISMREAHGWVLTAISMREAHGWVLTAVSTTQWQSYPMENEHRLTTPYNACIVI